MRKFLTVITALALASVALAETRTVNVNVQTLTGRPVPVSIDLLTLRDAIGAEFPMDWTSLKVTVDGAEVPYQIDDVDLNERISAGDYVGFLATGPAVIEISDAPADAAAYPSGFTVSGEDPVVIESLSTAGFKVEVPAHGLSRIVGYGETQDLLANEIGILRFSGFPESTFWANEQLGPHEEYTNLEAGGMRHVGTTVLAAGPARVTVVAEYASDRFVGLQQRLITHIYATGDVEVVNGVRFGGYSDMMKLQSMATAVMSQADLESLHLMPVFRRLLWADQLGTAPEAYFAERSAVTEVDGTPYLAFRTDDNLSPLFWGATYIFASAEPWRANYSPNLGVGVAELAYTTPEIVDDYDAWLSGNTWVFESQEFRTGVFKWTADEFGTYEATEGITPGESNHYLPGDTTTFHFNYSAFQANTAEDAIRYARDRQAELASVALE
ncbi:hypothetical protein [Guyparkeria sp.]|uniref:hypothetical protein n=1 Tax=Guyparkeria sp. TaxID=2035736 RepID=UPI0039711428